MSPVLLVALAGLAAPAFCAEPPRFFAARELSAAAPIRVEWEDLSAAASDPKSGRVALADAATGRVRVWASPGALLRAEAPAGEASAGEVEGLAFDGAGALWVADAAGRTLRRYDAPLAADAAASLVVTLPAGSSPRSLAVDAEGSLWVADAGRERLLRLRPPFSAASKPDLSLGAGELVAPEGVAVDAAGVWVTDRKKGRAYFYARPYAGRAALAVGAGSLGRPAGAVVDEAGLWVADADAARVLLFARPFAAGAAPTFALGARGATRGLEGSPLRRPTALASVSGGLLVADRDEGRALHFKPPWQDGMTTAASAGGTEGAARRGLLAGLAAGPKGELCAIDQAGERVACWPDAASLERGAAPRSFLPSGASALKEPNKAVFDRDGRLWISDSGHGRVLGFPPGLSLSTAVVVLGEGEFRYPQGMGFDRDGNLWVADTDRDLVVRYDAPLRTGARPALTLGAGILNSPHMAATDASGALWVSDYGHQRVLRFSKPLKADSVPDLVLGQESLGPTRPNRGGEASAGSVFFPTGFAFDRAGSLWLADLGNNRVLVFDPPFVSGMSASAVLGQPDFTAAGPDAGGVSPKGGFYGPCDVAFDRAGRAWVADGFNARVAGFSARGSR